MRSELFEETLKQHKDSLTDELEQLGKHRQVQLVEWDIEQNESDYEFYFNAAWNTQQSKVDELQLKLSEDSRILHNVIEIERKKNDELQKRLGERDLRIKRLIESEENIARGCESWRNSCSKLWKIEDAVTNVLKSMRKELEHGHLSDDESQTLSSYANDLEQALKGGEDA